MYLSSGVARGGQRGTRAPGATLGGRWNRPDRKDNRQTIWYILVRDQREKFRIINLFLRKWVYILTLYVLYGFLFTFENDPNLFWVYHFENFLGKNQVKGRQFHFLPLAPDTHATPLHLSTIFLYKSLSL